MMAAELTGPRLAPRSRGPARQLVIFLHGYGADGNDLIELGRAWQNLLPDAADRETVAGDVKVRPPILLIHGDRDDLIPAQALFLSAQYLSALDVPTEWHLSAGLAHGIDQEGLRHGGEFLARRFGSKGR